jgi:hypothetical protein
MHGGIAPQINKWICVREYSWKYIVSDKETHILFLKKNHGVITSGTVL